MLGLVLLLGRTSATKDVELLGSHAAVAAGLIDLLARRRSRPMTSATRPGRGSPRPTAIQGRNPGGARPAQPGRRGRAARTVRAAPPRGARLPSPGRPDPRWS